MPLRASPNFESNNSSSCLIIHSVALASSRRNTLLTQIIMPLKPSLTALNAKHTQTHSHTKCSKPFIMLLLHLTSIVIESQAPLTGSGPSNRSAMRFGAPIFAAGSNTDRNTDSVFRKCAEKWTRFNQHSMALQERADDIVKEEMVYIITRY